MSINEATRFDWDRATAKTGLEPWMRAAEEENSELWEDESLEEAIARQDEEEEPYTVSIPTHYDMTTEEGRNNMSLTLEELKEKMVLHLDEELLCELLSITPQDLVEAFERRIIRNFDRIAEDFEDEY